MSKRGLYECAALCIQNCGNPAEFVNWKNKAGKTALDMCDSEYPIETELDKEKCLTGRTQMKEILEEGFLLVILFFIKKQ